MKVGWYIRLDGCNVIVQAVKIDEYSADQCLPFSKQINLREIWIICSANIFWFEQDYQQNKNNKDYQGNNPFHFVYPPNKNVLNR